jgi:hypothetical protein
MGVLDGIHIRTTEVTVSAVPEPASGRDADYDLYDMASMKVSWRGNETYAVLRRSACLSSNGEWHHEPTNTNRSEEFIATHRFDYDTAVALAAEHSRKIVAVLTSKAEKKDGASDGE